MNTSDTANPVTIEIPLKSLDEVMSRLKMALSPQVTFSHDIEKMRNEADGKRTQHIVAAFDLLIACSKGNLEHHKL